MFRTRIIPVCLLALAVAGCKAQPASAAAPTPIPVDAKTARNVEVLARQKLKVPAEYLVTVGPRTPSEIPGFDNIRLTFSLPNRPDHSQTLSFLLSKDGKVLGRLTEWNIAGNPSDLIPYANRPVRGNNDAKVVIVNFDDLECPYCAQLHAELFPETLDHYKGLIKIVYRDLPLEEIHPWAMHAAVNANCLAAQSAAAYWSYVDYLHVHGQDVTGPDRNLEKSKATLDKLAADQGAKNGLDAGVLSACIAKQDETAIRAEMKQADSLGIAQTPTLFVNGEEMEGALDISTLWTIIDRALVAEGLKPPAKSQPELPRSDAPKSNQPAPAPAKPAPSAPPAGL